ncbi:unnamed protein product [Polarella glacialis]|uniref:Uncharacterized protein n=1 Tax=Polarella glacialis TaxID=89957 RepID=A0A813GZP2_POLGL|nr:unnamed protein product [Polarella glacialis]
MEDPRPSFLFKANKEIAEVRDDLIKADKQLDVVQAQNAERLEQTSELDSEVTRQCSRCAISEQRLAVLFDEQRQSSEELQEKQAAREASLSVLRNILAERREAFDRAEAGASSEKLSRQELQSELSRLREQLQTETATLRDVKIAREERTFATKSASAALAAELAVDSQLQAKTAETADHEAVVATTRTRIAIVQEEHSAELQRHEDLAQQLRKAVAEQVAESARVQSLEAEVAAGGDAGDVRSAVGAESSQAGSSSSTNNTNNINNNNNNNNNKNNKTSASELRSELAQSEERCHLLQLSWKETEQRSSQAVAKLRGDLDGARIELQRSLREAAEAHGNEVVNLENEVQEERQRASNEVLLEQSCAEQIQRLRESRTQLLADRVVGALQASGCATTLREELWQVKQEVSAEEMQIMDRRQRLVRAEQRQRDAKVDGDRRAMKVRSMIQDLWESLRAVRADIGD